MARYYIRPVHKRGISPVILPSGRKIKGTDVLTGFALTSVDGEILVDEQVIGHFKDPNDARDWALDIGVDLVWGDVLWT